MSFRLKYFIFHNLGQFTTDINSPKLRLYGCHAQQNLTE